MRKLYVRKEPANIQVNRVEFQEKIPLTIRSRGATVLGSRETKQLLTSTAQAPLRDARKMPSKAISLGYHDILTATSLPGSHTPMSRYLIDVDVFQDQLCAIQKTGRANAVAVINGVNASIEDVPLFLTFDDGALSAYTIVARELERRNWRGHFFVTTDWIGKPGYLHGAQIRELNSCGHIIGSHTCSHPERMSALPWSALTKEWSTSCDILSNLLGERVTVASVAGGYYSRKVAAAAAASGIEVLFTSEPTTQVWQVDGCWVLGRYSVQRQTAPSVTAAIVEGQRWPRWKQTLTWQAKKPLKAVTGDSYRTITQSFR